MAKTTEKTTTTKKKATTTTKKKVAKKTAESNTTSIETSQPEINIGLIGHVDHGKTTLTERLSGKWTDTHSEEIKRGITIRLGYADLIFRKCNKCKGQNQYSTKEACPKCGEKTTPIRKVSLIDAPGHESLMATMLAGSTIIDGALLLVAANENCPQPQTKEHLMALEIMGVKNVIVIQNKIDLINEEKALKNYKQIKDFLNDTNYKNAPIIPISAMHGVNIGALIEKIEELIPTPVRDKDSTPLMFVARSFDINKPGSKIKNVVGGVLGGSLKQGELKIGDEIEIRPGIKINPNQQVWTPIITKITSVSTGSNRVDKIGPGGSTAIMTSLDPSIVKSDKLSGNTVGLKGKLPPVRDELFLDVNLLQRVVGTKEDLVVNSIAKGESLMLNVNSASTVGVVIDISKKGAKCKLKLPVCAEEGARVTISRLIGNRFRLIGYGIIKE